MARSRWQWDQSSSPWSTPTRPSSTRSPGVTAMKPVLTVNGVTPDSDFPNLPGAVREWCINSAAIDAVNQCAVVNSEDGHVLIAGASSRTRLSRRPQPGAADQRGVHPNGDRPGWARPMPSTTPISSAASDAKLRGCPDQVRLRISGTRAVEASGFDSTPNGRDLFRQVALKPPKPILQENCPVTIAWRTAILATTHGQRSW